MLEGCPSAVKNPLERVQITSVKRMAYGPSWVRIPSSFALVPELNLMGLQHGSTSLLLPMLNPPISSLESRSSLPNSTPPMAAPSSPAMTMKKYPRRELRLLSPTSILLENRSHLSMQPIPPPPPQPNLQFLVSTTLITPIQLTGQFQKIKDRSSYLMTEVVWYSD
jgi:hypothetical protein